MEIWQKKALKTRIDILLEKADSMTRVKQQLKKRSLIINYFSVCQIFTDRPFC